MEYSQFFFTLFCMVAFCLGLNQIMSEGNILYFLRKPFENLYDEIENKQKIYIDLKPWRRSHELIELSHQINALKLKYYLAKPLVLCITCFASLWGGGVFVSLNGLNENLLPYLVISCISSAYIQTAIYVKINI
jgi:hypothetical protein